MKTTKWMALMALACLAISARPTFGNEIAEAFMQALEAGDFESAHAMLDEDAADQLTEPLLIQTWEALPAQLGEYRGRGPARRETIAGRELTVYRLDFANMALDARIAVDADGRIDGFRLLPAPPAPGPAPGAAEFEGGEEIRVDVAGDLPGLLALPHGDGPFAAVVLVHGSGPNDRDETIGPNKPFRDLAHGLAQRGIASLRYDKRTLVQPERFETGAYTVDDEVIDDALTATDLLRERPEIDSGSVFVLGHSLGAMLAPRIAAVDAGLAGIILAAAPARPMGEVLLQQLNHIAASDGEVAPAETTRIEAIRAEVQAMAEYRAETAAQPGLLGAPQAYWLDLAGYDPVAKTKELAIPVLVLQGGRDYQVTVEDDFARWRQVFEDSDRVVLRLYPNLNHLFVAGEGMATPAEYMTRAGHVDKDLLDDLAEFIHTRREGQR